jgi:hypothetical protein
MNYEVKQKQLKPLVRKFTYWEETLTESITGCRSRHGTVTGTGDLVM